MASQASLPAPAEGDNNTVLPIWKPDNSRNSCIHDICVFSIINNSNHPESVFCPSHVLVYRKSLKLHAYATA
ncbi:MAG TPA: hypothetical protein PL099_05155 [Thermoclostridium caenicola]|nr:hypothetical protein [Thermoclostridium caenicola]